LWCCATMPDMSKPASKGRCIGCGFLCRRDIVNAHLSNLTEITRSDRNNHKFFHFTWRNDPECFRGVPIRAEISVATRRTLYGPRPKDDAEADGIQEDTYRVLSKDRHCRLWHPYTEGLSPAAHLEDFKMQQLENNHRFWVYVVVFLAAIQAIFGVLAWLGPRHVPPPPTVIVNPSIIVNPVIEVPVTVTPVIAP